MWILLFSCPNNVAASPGLPPLLVSRGCAGAGAKWTRASFFNLAAPELPVHKSMRRTQKQKTAFILLEKWQTIISKQVFSSWLSLSGQDQKVGIENCGKSSERLRKLQTFMCIVFYIPQNFTALHQTNRYYGHFQIRTHREREGEGERWREERKVLIFGRATFIPTFEFRTFFSAFRFLLGVRF